MIVDDEPAILTLVSGLLTAKGHRVMQAASGEEARELVSPRPPIDLFILDIMLPEMTGYQLLAFLRKRRVYTKVPVIMLTVKKQEHDIIKGYREGADVYITKPFATQELVNMVDYLISRKGKDPLLAAPPDPPAP